MHETRRILENRIQNLDLLQEMELKGKNLIEPWNLEEKNRLLEKKHLMPHSFFLGEKNRLLNREDDPTALKADPNLHENL